jgi:hypothetical protein
LIRQMKRQMVEHAAQLCFERASWIKRHIDLLQGRTRDSADYQPG